MRPAHPMPYRAVEELEGLLAAAKSRPQYQRVQCVWLRATLGLSLDEVARAVGWHTDTFGERQLENRV